MMKKLLSFLLATCLVPVAALGHAMLESAMPRVGSTVPNAPGELLLTYSDRIEPHFTTVAVTNAAGARVDRGPLHVDPQDNTHLLVPVQKLPPGTYTVRWHAVSVDAHKTAGSYHFTVAAP